MSVRVRIEAAFEDMRFEPDPDGKHTKEVDIPGSGLTIDEVKDDKVVEDAFMKDDGSFHVYVSADSEGRYIAST